ncbi:DUF2809 domain-containing protein [Microbacterium sp. E-13]|uniref:DUF2809 domain-containing protein n=1 Tax=Microbacterium sp. E-13 TaxID=3404048 RepID=UPI003CF85FA4
MTETDAAPAAPRRAIGRRRLTAGVLLAVTVAAGLLVHGLLPDDAATDITGDALYAVAAYLAVVLLAPRLPALAAGIIAAAWCVVVELFQLTGLPLAWGAHFTPAMLVFGTVFDPRDLLVYFLTVALASTVDMLLSPVRRHR